MSSSISSKLTSSDIETSDDSYITAQLSVSKHADKFTVGDDNTYGGYVNRPLHLGSYTFYIGLKPVTEEVVDFTSSLNWQVEIVPAEPTELSVHARGSTTALLTWTAPTWTDVHYPIINYQVKCEIHSRTYNPSETRYPLYFNTRLLSKTLTSLNPQVQYGCYVRAVLSQGYGRSSIPITFWTKPAEVEWSFSEELVVNEKLVTLPLPKVTYPDSLSGYESLLIAAQMSSSISSKLTSTDIETHDDSYITAELPVTVLSDKFTVGDNITYGGYVNRPLHLGNYTFYIGLKPVTEKPVDFTSSFNWQVEIVPTERLIAPVTLRSSDSALLKWTKPDQLKRNYSVIGYEILCFIRNSTYNPAANRASLYVTENNLSANVTSLSPQVQYSCHVRAHLSNGYRQWSGYTVFWTKPAAIDWSFSEQKPVVHDTLVTLTLPTQPPTLNRQSPPGYESLLIAVQKKSRVKRELSSADIETNEDYYITAELPVSSWSNIFTIGDKNTYGSYINKPLQFGSYTFYIGLKPVTEEVADFTTSPYWQIEIVAPPANSFQNAVLIGGTGGGFAIILLIAVILVVLLLRKRSRKGSEKAVGAQHTGLEMSSANAMRRSRHIEEEAAEPLLHTNEDKNLYAIVGLGTPNTPPILVSELHLVVQQAKEGNPDSPFNDEFSQIGHPNMACNDGKKTENVKKNRFKNIMAPDTTRVKLTIANDSDTDYINANYIKDAKKRNKFIACQGPIDQTIEDMWRMIHDTNSSTIVMLTNPVEANKAKCSIYYPEGEISCEVFGRFEVRLVEEQRFAEYTIRKLEYTFGERTRAVRLFHFTAWPEHGVPTTAGLLDFRHRVKQEMAINAAPTIVHCSAGVGRTGTFIALDLLIEEAMNQPKKSQSKVNVVACVHRMRLQRPKLIKTVEQYAFLYEVLVEALVCGETAVTCAQFDEKLDKWRNKRKAGHIGI
ncbi:receptor-type tyrosine-protein phosphatase kappa-like [Watersipora subatra]|uniref:receptor-type tyrosine-protein phosphatase kappa-like n=1 Tax=Watersipora subatra TaxID=2589382 RepID=UPI00355BD92B